MTGKRFRLTKVTKAVDIFGAGGAVTVPSGVIVSVLSYRGAGRLMVDVLFDNRTLVMFTADLVQHSVGIAEQSVSG